ncbi:Exonuclease DPD1 [Diplonema papillatum]|nr:Exonuclease DPD1 [Diplonema papillatum]
MLARRRLPLAMTPFAAVQKQWVQVRFLTAAERKEASVKEAPIAVAAKAAKGKKDAQPAGMHIFVWDIETTGLNSSRDQVIELGCLHPASGKQFQAMIRPTEAKMSPDAAAVHGIQEAQLAKCHPFSSVWPQFHSWVQATGQPCSQGRLLLLSHFTFSLDVPLLNAELTRLSTTVPEHWVMADAATAIRSKVEKGTPLNLDSLTKQYSIEGRTHRAAEDAERCWKVIEKLYPDKTLSKITAVYKSAHKKGAKPRAEKKQAGVFWYKWVNKKKPAQPDPSTVQRFSKSA